MHLVFRSETYKTTSGVVTQALGRIEEVPIKRSDSKTNGRDGDDTQEHTPGNSEAEDGLSLWCKYGTNEQKMVQESESESDSSEDSDEGTQSVGPNGGVSEFGDTEFEELVKKEGLQQILQLTMQNKADDFMKEELTNADDYAD
ncbi:unnamed protein product [Sphagnum tenellum]